MAFLACDEDEAEYIYRLKPTRIDDCGIWISACYPNGNWSETIKLPSGTIEKLIGRPLTWEDEPQKI